MIMSHAFTVKTVYACTIAVLHAQIMIIVHACVMKTVPAHTIPIVHVSWSTGLMSGRVCFGRRHPSHRWTGGRGVGVIG